MKNLALLLGIVMFITVLYMPTVQAAWWDGAWLYKRSVDFTNTNTYDLIEYHQNVTLDTATLISEGKMQNACGDIRVVNETSGEVLPMSYENCNTSYTYVYFKPSIVIGGNSDEIFIYYGNSNTSITCPECIFPALAGYYDFYDNFETDYSYNSKTINYDSGGFKVGNFSSRTTSWTRYGFVNYSGVGYEEDAAIFRRNNTIVANDSYSLEQYATLTGVGSTHANHFSFIVNTSGYKGKWSYDAYTRPQNTTITGVQWRYAIFTVGLYGYINPNNVTALPDSLYYTRYPICAATWGGAGDWCGNPIGPYVRYPAPEQNLTLGAWNHVYGTEVNLSNTTDDADYAALYFRNIYDLSTDLTTLYFFVDDVKIWKDADDEPVSTLGDEIFSNNAIQTCGDLTNTTTIGFILKDEEDFEDVVGDVEITFEIAGTNFSFDSTDKNYHEFCLYPPNNTFYGNVTLKYKNSSYSDRWYYLINETFDNTTTNYTLYLLNTSDSSYVEFTLRDGYHVLLDNHVMELQRYFPENGTYITIAMGLTGLDGKTTIPLKYYERYQFIIWLNGQFVSRTAPAEISSSEKDVFTATETRATYYKWFNNVNYTCSNSTDTITCTIVDTSEELEAISLNVTRLRAFNYSDTICYNYSTTLTTLTCNVSEYLNETLLYYLFSGRFEGQWHGLESGEMSQITPLGEWGVMGILLALMILVTMAFAGLWTPVASLLFGFVGLIVGFVLGLFVVDHSALIGIGLVFAIIAYKIRG